MRATAARYPVVGIADAEPIPLPGFDRLVLSHVELPAMMREHRYAWWRRALASVFGTYLITDTCNGPAVRRQSGRRGEHPATLERLRDLRHGGTSSFVDSTPPASDSSCSVSSTRQHPRGTSTQPKATSKTHSTPDGTGSASTGSATAPIRRSSAQWGILSLYRWLLVFGLSSVRLRVCKQGSPKGPRAFCER